MLWIYKCNARAAAVYLSGDWAPKFDDPGGPFVWGDSELIRSNSSRKAIRELMRTGDVVLAWQVDRAEAVGLCAVVDIDPIGERLEIVLETTKSFSPPVRLRELRRSDARLWKVKAFHPGRQGTLHAASPAEARLLLEVCGVTGLEVGSVARRPPRTAAGFVTVLQNRATEQAAVQTVTQRLRRDGWAVQSVERDHRGFDLHARRAGEVAHIDVKGVGGGEPCFVMTSNELRRAAEDTRYWVCVVTNALKPRQRNLTWWHGSSVSSFDQRTISAFVSGRVSKAVIGPALPRK